MTKSLPGRDTKLRYDDLESNQSLERNIFDALFALQKKNNNEFLKEHLNPSPILYSILFVKKIYIFGSKIWQ